jgi:ABC-2 type transport system ATP-binding protein
MGDTLDYSKTEVSRGTGPDRAPAGPADLVLNVSDVSRRFGTTVAVEDVTLSVRRGEVFGFLGPNGAGKSTTIRLILGLLRPHSGSIDIAGFPVNGRTKREALRRTGALVEGPAFYPYLSALENLRIFAAYTADSAEKRIPELIELVGLKGRGHDRVSGYSLGMKQRLGIAQALLGQPQLLLLDEPTNGLDPYGVKEIRTLIRRLSSELGTTVFLSSHILSEVQQVCDRVAVINRGRIVSSGRVAELLNGHATRYNLDGPDRESLRLRLERRTDIRILPEASVVPEPADPAVAQHASDERLRIELGETKPEDLLCDLVTSGSRISTFAPVPRTLEDFFFEATDSRAPDTGNGHREDPAEQGECDE